MQPDVWLTLVTLTFLEIILGANSIIFLSLVVTKLPLSQQSMTRKLGLSCMMIMWVLLLISIAWLPHITQPLFIALTLETSFCTLILFGNRPFLIYKAIQEIREELSPMQEDKHGNGSRRLSSCGATVQIMLLDIVSSLDSVITAVDLSQHIFIMIAVVMITVSVMMFVAKTIGDFASATLSIKILALTFLLFVGVLLVTDNLNTHIAKEYPYFAVFFSLSVETLNTIHERKNKKVPTSFETHEPRSH